jgi:hypothetical protein
MITLNRTVLAVFLTAASLVTLARGDNAAVTRELAWDGSESLVLEVPAHVRFVQATGPGRVVVTGSRRSVETFSATGGVLRDKTLRTGAPLQIVITAPKITRFSAKGDDRIAIEAFDQDELHIETTGRADIKAAGRAGTVTLKLQGFGWADLSHFKSDGADLTITGGRNAVIAPSAWAKLSGKGDVVLLTQPSDLKIDPQGSGRVIHAGPAR